MDKKDYAIIGLLIVIIMMLSCAVVTLYIDSQPEIFDFDDFAVTAPAGSHCHASNGVYSFYLNENDSIPVVIVSTPSSDFSAEDFDLMVDQYNNGEVSKEEIIQMWNEDSEENVTVKDFNVGDFYGEPEMSILVVNMSGSNEEYLIHSIKHNNDKSFLVIELLGNEYSSQMYANLILK